MSTDYCFANRVGFEFSVKELQKAFGFKIREKSHKEDRFDPKTGAKLQPEKVVDVEEHIGYKFLGKVIKDSDYEEVEELSNLIARHLKCLYNTSDGYNGVVSVVFGPKMPRVLRDGDSFGHVDGPASYPFDAIAKMAPELKRIEKGLKKLGLQPGKAGIFVLYSVG